MKKRPTILQIIPLLETGGAERTTVEMADAVVRAGGRALVASGGGRLVAEVRAAGGEIVDFPAASKNPLTMRRNVHRLAELAFREGVDLLHARSRAPAWSALGAARRCGLPFVTTYHGAYSEKSWIKKRYNSVMAAGDVVIANSHFTAGLVRSRYETPEAKIRVIHRGVSPVVFAPEAVTPERIAALRAAWRLAPEDRVILHPARLTRWKGQLDLLAAVARLGSQSGTKIGNAVVVFAGDAQGRYDYLQEIERRAADLGLSDRVRLAGHCADMPAAYASAYVTVVASTEPEAFGRAAVEAQVMGCPVISTDIGAPPETVLAPPRVSVAYATGWLVPPADADAMARALTEAMSLSVSQRAALGARARAHVIGSFTVAKMQRETLAVYDELLGTNLARQFADNSRAEVPPVKDRA